MIRFLIVLFVISFTFLLHAEEKVKVEEKKKVNPLKSFLSKLRLRKKDKGNAETYKNVKFFNKIKKEESKFTVKTPSSVAGVRGKTTVLPKKEEKKVEHEPKESFFNKLRLPFGPQKGKTESTKVKRKFEKGSIKHRIKKSN